MLEARARPAPKGRTAWGGRGAGRAVTKPSVWDRRVQSQGGTLVWAQLFMFLVPAARLGQGAGGRVVIAPNRGSLP